MIFLVDWCLSSVFLGCFVYFLFDVCHDCGLFMDIWNLSLLAMCLLGSFSLLYVSGQLVLFGAFEKRN